MTTLAFFYLNSVKFAIILHRARVTYVLKKHWLKYFKGGQYSPEVFISIRALDDLWRENSGAVNRLPLSKFEFCGESFYLMKTKLAISVQMCGVRRLEQWIYSIFSKHVSFFRDGMDNYPCVPPFKQDKIIWPWCFNGLLKYEQKLITVRYPFYNIHIINSKARD